MLMTAGLLALQTVESETPREIQLANEALLKKLGLPVDLSLKPQKQPRGVPFLINLIEERKAGRATGVMLSDVIRSLNYQETTEEEHDTLKIHLSFEVPTKMNTKEVFRAAKLRISAPEPLQHPTESALKVFDVIRPARGSKNDPIRSLIQESEYADGSSIDLTSAFRRWLKKPRTNHGIDVEIHRSTPNRRKRHEEKPIAHPDLLLLTFSDEDNTSAVPREKRAYSHARKGLCQRRDLLVSFKDIGWDERIIHPKEVNVFSCQGKCGVPFTDFLAPTSHAILKSLLHSNQKASSPVCCVPTRFDPIDLLVNDENGEAVMEHYKDMAVATCGCR